MEGDRLADLGGDLGKEGAIANVASCCGFGAKATVRKRDLWRKRAIAILS